MLAAALVPTPQRSAQQRISTLLQCVLYSLHGDSLRSLRPTIVTNKTWHFCVSITGVYYISDKQNDYCNTFDAHLKVTAT